MRLTWLRQHADFLPFAIIGAFNTCLHGLVLVWAVEKAGLHLIFAHFSAFTVANFFSYVANSKLTFKIKLSWRHYGKFLFASLLALGLTLSIAWLANHWGIHYLLGFALIVVTVPFFSFFIIKFWALSSHHSSNSHHV